MSLSEGALYNLSHMRPVRVPGVGWPCTCPFCQTPEAVVLRRKGWRCERCGTAGQTAAIKQGAGRPGRKRLRRNKARDD